PHGAERLKDLLVGQILWVEPRELLPVAVLYAGVLATFFMFDLRRHRALFYVLFAVTITASVQLVGIFLVFTSLILPALAATGLTLGQELIIGYVTGLAGYVLGLLGADGCCHRLRTGCHDCSDRNDAFRLLVATSRLSLG